MTQEELIEGNKLIPEFMGAKYVKEYGWEFGTFGSPLSNNNGKLKFHSSWDWIMEVLKKIGTGMTTYIITENYTTITTYKLNGGVEFEVSIGGGESALYQTWKAVVQFIKWYNENKS